MVIKQLFTDHLTQTTLWEERKMPALPKIVEVPWSSKTKSYEEAYEEHWRNIIEFKKTEDFREKFISY